MKILPLLKVGLLAAGFASGLAAAPSKETVIVVSWGDIIGNPRFAGAA